MLLRFARPNTNTQDDRAARLAAAGRSSRRIVVAADSDDDEEDEELRRPGQFAFASHFRLRTVLLLPHA